MAKGERRHTIKFPLRFQTFNNFEVLSEHTPTNVLMDVGSRYYKDKHWTIPDYVLRRLVRLANLSVKERKHGK